ncbi:MAG TPA: hypothetical protein VM099_04575 [Gemmatimonadaceae bacterium]|nr:hypothetical protein [Gemmatimonadaceae bacterium]
MPHTHHELLHDLLHFPDQTKTKGISARGEIIFNVAAAILMTLFALGWGWSIALARAGISSSHASETSGILTSALTDADAPSMAYLTDAALDVVNPLRGESGKLKARIAQPGETISRDTLRPGAVATFSNGAKAESSAVLNTPAKTGIWSIAIAIGSAIKPITDFSVITLLPASEKKSGRIGLYYIGNWPTGRVTPKADYTPPSGFIEVTQQTQNTALSEHFRLRDFFPHDQANVWPKYIVVKMKLVDKLELVLQDLAAHGIRSDRVRVLSGFRTPQYNAGGGDPRGRAALSRHMYGDASDIFIDNDGNGSMDDLNHDGKVNINDARVILAAVNRVEAAHPSLIGGCGVYAGTSAHGPFTHIDTRGYPARWIGTGDN